MKPAAIVAAPNKPAGRGQKLTSPPVKILAEKHGIPVLQPEKLDESFRFQVSGFSPDVFVIASYGKILPQALLAIPSRGTINVHPSLLPRYRGPAPLQAAILSGDEITGVTLMLTDEKMDHGPILAKREWQIQNSQITYLELHNILAELGGELLVEILPKWVVGEITPREQDHENATYTKLFTKEDGHIDWNKSAEEIDRTVRALNPWPGTWSFLVPGTIREKIFGRLPSEYSEGNLPIPNILKRVKILSGYPTDEHYPAVPGTLFKTKSGQLATCTGNGTYVIEKLQIEGKKVTGDILSWADNCRLN